MIALLMFHVLALHSLGMALTFGWLVLIIRLGAEMGYPFPGGKRGLILPTLLWPLTLGCMLLGRPDDF